MQICIPSSCNRSKLKLNQSLKYWLPNTAVWSIVIFVLSAVYWVVLMDSRFFPGNHWLIRLSGNYIWGSWGIPFGVVNPRVLDNSTRDTETWLLHTTCFIRIYMWASIDTRGGSYRVAIKVKLSNNAKKKFGSSNFSLLDELFIWSTRSILN